MSVVKCSGPSDAEVAFVGEAPGRQEAKMGLGFVGPSGDEPVVPIIEGMPGDKRQHEDDRNPDDVSHRAAPPSICSSCIVGYGG